MPSVMGLVFGLAAGLFELLALQLFEAIIFIPGQRSRTRQLPGGEA